MFDRVFVVDPGFIKSWSLQEYSMMNSMIPGYIETKFS